VYIYVYISVFFSKFCNRVPTALKTLKLNNLIGTKQCYQNRNGTELIKLNVFIVIIYHIPLTVIYNLNGTLFYYLLRYIITLIVCCINTLMGVVYLNWCYISIPYWLCCNLCGNINFLPFRLYLYFFYYVCKIILKTKTNERLKKIKTF